MEQSFRLRLDEEQEQTLIQYIKSRRYGTMLTLYLSAAFLVLTSPLAYADMLLLFEPRPGRSAMLPQITLAAGTLARYHYRRHVDGEFFFFWVGVAIVLLVTFLRGYGRRFGKNSDYDCVRNGKYAYEIRPFGAKGPDNGKHPYFLADDTGTYYLCPVFLDYKNAGPDRELLCVHLDNGHNYALLAKDTTPWWEKD